MRRLVAVLVDHRHDEREIARVEHDDNVGCGDHACDGYANRAQAQGDPRDHVVDDQHEVDERGRQHRPATDSGGHAAGA